MARLFVHNLTALDFAYLDGERGLLGESWRVHVELAGSLDGQGMVLDFAAVKKGVKQTLDRHFDHRLLVPCGHPNLVVEQQGDDCLLEFRLSDGSAIRHRSPSQALAFVDAPKIDVTSVVTSARQLLQPQLPGNVTELTLALEPESIDGPYFHYAHGLKHHAGNCQRIAHGHRSRLQIYRNGQRAPELETEWANRWRDIYIATREDVLADTAADPDVLCVGYVAAQGAFRLDLPARRCYLVDGDSTIENLAQHLAEIVARKHLGDTIRARVFEGIDKGADGEAIASV
jgi:6-pyruvoyl-tetrahydropterin synthase